MSTLRSMAEALAAPEEVTTLDLRGSAEPRVTSSVRVLRRMHTLLLDDSGVCELPKELWELEALRTVSLCRCPVSIISDIQGLEQIHRLDLTGCRLPESAGGAGTFIHYLGRLTQLRELVLDQMAMETLPSSALAPFKSLRTLSLQRNYLTSFILQDGVLEALERLDLAGNDVSTVEGAASRPLLRVHGLRDPCVQGVVASPAAPSAPATIQQKLEVDDQLDGVEAILAGAPEGSVELTGKGLGYAALWSLERLLNQHGAAIGALSLSAKAPRGGPYHCDLRALDFERLPSLHRLSLQRCVLGREIFVHPRLRELVLSECNVKGATFVRIGVERASALQSFDANDCNFRGPGEEPRRLEVGPGSELQTLSLSLDQDFAESFFDDIICSDARSLASISVRACATVRVKLQGSLPALTSLALSRQQYGSYEIENLSDRDLSGIFHDLDKEAAEWS